MNIQSMYQEVILDHYKNPHHSGLREPFSSEVHHVNTSCGDELTLRLFIQDNIVKDISYEAQGCSISQASTSVLAQELTGLPVNQALEKLNDFENMITSRGQYEGDPELIGDGIAFSGVSQYPARVKCALLGWKAFEAALTEIDSAQIDTE